MLDVCAVLCFAIPYDAELCGGGDGGEEAEVTLVSLLEEQLPRYILRADTITDFSGYENGDWIVRTPCLREPNVPISPQVMDETLKYFGT